MEVMTTIKILAVLPEQMISPKINEGIHKPYLFDWGIMTSIIKSTIVKFSEVLFELDE